MHSQAPARSAAVRWSRDACSRNASSNGVLLETRGSARSRRHSSTPAMSGSSASTMMTSGSVPRARSSAYRPEGSRSTA